ncbi:MAG: CIA30 family protein [Phycisphaerae bacterium]|nr:CIA30 family protein [Phycisphaerae bacterium]
MRRHARWIVAVVATAAGAFLGGCGPQGSDEPLPPTQTLYDFTEQDDPGDWKIITDGVMGGKSQASFEPADNGAALSGTISLENFGGFAAARAPFEKRNLKGYDGLAVRVRGDGKKYRLYIKTTALDDGLMYWAPFEPPADEWTTMRVPFAKFAPHLRGVPLILLAAANDQPIHSVGLLIADKQKGPFNIQIGSITAYRDEEPADDETSDAAP